MRLRSSKTDIRSIALLLLIFGGFLFVGTLLAGADANKALETPAPVSIPAKISDPRPGSPIDLYLSKGIHNDTTPELNILNPKHPKYGKFPLPPRGRLPVASPAPGMQIMQQ